MDVFGLAIPLPLAEILLIVGAIDIILGIVSKHTPWKWDDSLYSLLHGLVMKLPGVKK